MKSYWGIPGPSKDQILEQNILLKEDGINLVVEPK